ncbi:MoaD/ThiS family protein [Nocardioides jiangxiensis]|uniref:MoaD/ThiS family protein n=1 Tax=Nocardioides jiangxiensis TaxID=3064524 RepID=A0ABT9AZI4_9ACTN|nr:MoaD/ThiS family protein [Nocardioides sp. WY-20]MDO7867865.1 MoaD/ThiS family protein [Nocardioides sp. WY-20]
MSLPAPVAPTITVRYWAGARAAAGVAEEQYDGPLSVAGLREAALARHPESDRLAGVLAVCSVLVDGQQPGADAVQPGSVVEFLPPFAGG